jgi:hypothetical protein
MCGKPLLNDHQKFIKNLLQRTGGNSIQHAMMLLAASMASLGHWKQLIKKKKRSYERKLMASATVYCHANKILLWNILFYNF